MVCGWAGAGDALSIGRVGEWGGEEPITRIIVHGLVDGDHAAVDGVIADRRRAIQGAFEAALLTDDELRAGALKASREDGLETWLGPIDTAAA